MKLPDKYVKPEPLTVEDHARFAKDAREAPGRPLTPDELRQNDKEPLGTRLTDR